MGSLTASLLGALNLLVITMNAHEGNRLFSIA